MKYLTGIICGLGFGLAAASCFAFVSSQQGHGSHGSQEAHGSHDEQTRIPKAGKKKKKFPTVGFEERHEVTIPFPTGDVCPLFEPEGRNLIYSWWNPTVLREPEGKTLKGLVTVSEMSSHEIYLIVTEHNPEQGHLQYLVLWDDFELQKIDITCEEGRTKQTTKVIWNERNAGLHKNGVSMVSKFVKGGHLKAVVERYAQQAEKYLQDKK